MGKEVPDSGSISINKEIQIVLFDQEIYFDPEITIEQFMMSLDTPPIIALKNYHQAIISQNPAEMEKAITEMETLKIWDLENEMKQILSQLKINDLSLKMKNLSGGQIKRVALAKLLTETRAEHKHTLLIMDEPTNHLDAESIDWLEQHLQQYEGTVIAVTHDRYFLDDVSEWILELDRGEGIPWK